jgi:HlyD family secretion protein
VKKSLWWGIGIVFVLALAYGVWWVWGRNQGPVKVKAIAVAPISMQEEVYATGNLVPVSRQEVRVLNPGLVKKVAVKVGDSVKAGQILVTLDTTPTQQGQMTYKATIAGTVIEVNAQEGNLSSLQQPLVIVADLVQMNVETQLNEVDVGKVQLGGKATVTSKVLGNTSVQGTIDQIALEAVSQPSVQGNALPTVGVRIHLDQVPAGLKPGSTVSMQIIVATKKGVLAVPQEALFQEGSNNYVYSIQGGSVHKTEVKIGIGNDTQQEISSGLKAGDLVVLNPSNQLSEGLLVTPDTGSGGT